MINQPVVKLGVVGVSRDCFPIQLTRTRLAALAVEIKKAKLDRAVAVSPVVIESEKDALAALKWAREEGVNAACMFLGNFGPEGPATIFVEKLGVPTMMIAAKEESRKGFAIPRGGASLAPTS